MNNKTTLGFGSLLLSAFIYGFYGILTRLVGFHIPLFYGSILRNGLGMLFLLIIMLISHNWKYVHKKDMVYILFRSVFGMVGFLGSFIPLVYIPISTFYFIFYAGLTIGGYIIGKLLMKEEITKIKILSLVIALIGLSFIYSFSADASQIMYLLISFIGGLGMAGWNVFSKKISHTYSAVQLNFLDFALFALFDIVLSVLFGEVWVLPTLSVPWLASLGFTIMFVVTGQLMIYGFKYLDSQIGSLVLLTEILFAILFAFILFHETITAYTFIGGTCIIAAVILPEMYVLRKKRK